MTLIHAFTGTSHYSIGRDAFRRRGKRRYNIGPAVRRPFPPTLCLSTRLIMTKVSLDGLSVSDLTALQVQIDEQIKVKHEETRQEVKKQILALLAESGFSVADIFPSAKGQKAESGPARKMVKVKYSDGRNNWTGRGKMPLWIKSYIQGGGQLASLAVSK
jgi:DNA-binding protein H-NS